MFWITTLINDGFPKLVYGFLIQEMHVKMFHNSLTNDTINYVMILSRM